MSFKNKVVLITGASSGIGAATAFRLAKLDASLALIGRNETKLRKTEEKCHKLSPTSQKPLIIIADVTEEGSARKIIDETIKKFGKIDVLINNAGGGWKGRFTDPDALELYDKIEKTNLRQVLRITHTALPYLEKTKGCIVNVSSVNSMKAVVNSWAYCIAKAGLDHFTRILAVELSSKGIRVNSINPGPVYTDILTNAGLEEAAAKNRYDLMANATLLKRVSEPDEIADLIEFLASDRAKGVTGSVFLSDNGFMLGSFYQG